MHVMNLAISKPDEGRAAISRSRFLRLFSPKFYIISDGHFSQKGPFSGQIRPISLVISMLCVKVGSISDFSPYSGLSKNIFHSIICAISSIISVTYKTFPPDFSLSRPL